MESQRQEGTNKSAMRRIGAQEDSGKGRLRGAQEGSVMREGSETGTGRSSGTAAVSYTHLTLPTIYSV